MVVPVRNIVSQSQQSNTIATYEFPHNKGTHGLLLVFRRYTYQPTRRMILEQPVQTTIGSVLLPLPRQIIDQSNLRLNRVELGNMGEIAAKALADGQGDINAIYSSIKSMAPSGTDVAHGLSTIGKKIMGFDASFSEDFLDQVNFLARKAVNGLFDSRALDVGSGTAINPKQALSFEGVNMREYDFDFELMPSSPEESDTIRDIQRFIHANSLPAYRDLSFGQARMLQRVFLEYPSTVDMYLIGVDQDYYMHFKPCMIQRFNVNLTPTGGSQHAILKGGKPAMVTFNISLAELDIRTREDYGWEPEQRAQREITRGE